eukprot:2732438-Pyramimonas_sp.AAC.1
MTALAPGGKDETLPCRASRVLSGEFLDRGGGPKHGDPFPLPVPSVAGRGDRGPPPTVKRLG